jgi:hypothetical protein
MGCGGVLWDPGHPLRSQPRRVRREGLLDLREEVFEEARGQRRLGVDVGFILTP